MRGGCRVKVDNMWVVEVGVNESVGGVENFKRNYVLELLLSESRRIIMI